MIQGMKIRTLILPISFVAVAGGAFAFGLQQRARADRAELEASALHAALADIQEHASEPAPQTIEPEPVPVPPEVVLETAGTQHELASLQARIAELEGALLERDNSIRSLQAQVAAAATPVPVPATAQQEAPNPGRDWIENLRENDPERYEMVLQRRAEARERLQGALADKSEFLFARERPWVGPESLQTYEQMAQIIEDTWVLAESIDAEGLNRDERREMRRDLMRNLTRLGPMLETERDREFHNMAVAFGYNEQEAWEFVEYLNQVNELTSLRPLYQSLWGGGGRRGGGRDP